MASAGADTHHEYIDIARLYVPVAIAVFAIVTLVLIAFIVRFRAREDDGREPRRRSENNPLEIAYAVALAVVVVVLLVVTFRAETRVDAIARTPALRVRVTAAQWDWRFEQGPTSVVQGTVRTRGELVVPAGRTIRFEGRSLDVIHDFWVPDVRYQHQLFPGRVERWDLVFPHPGRYEGVCAFFCGLYHQDMHFVITAVAPDKFVAWRRARLAAARGTGA